MIITLIILGWLICSALSHGMLFAYLQRKYFSSAKEDYREDMSMSIMLSLILGPAATLFALSVTGFAKYGLKFK